MREKTYSIIAISGVLLLMLSIFNSCVQEETFAKATVATNEVTLITEATANCGGMISADGGSNVTARGVCWSTSPNPTVENDTTIDAAGTGPYSSSIKGLSPSTTYFVRAYAVNKGGIGYGLQMTFTTKTFSITTTTISLITATSAIGGGNIISNGDDSSLTVIARGVCWNTFPTPTIENSKTTDGVGGGIFTSNFDSLTSFTTYYVRAYATNSVGTNYGNEVSFTTQNGVIGLSTSTASLISAFTAISGGIITSDGGAAVTARGVCWNTSSEPTTANNKTANGSGKGTFSANITGLTPFTTYYVRAYATNSFGTVYGAEVSFTTLALKGTLTDIEGNVYNFITIGNQEWMVENLKTTKYNDGTSIPNITDGTTWANLSTPGYCFYNNDAANKTINGALYNWYTINTNKLAPTGWHVATDAEWTTLTTYLTNNGYGYGGSGSDIAKSMASTSGWNSDSGTGTIGNDLTKNNSSGFTALPGGHRDDAGTFGYLGSMCYWWSTTEYNTSGAWTRNLIFNQAYLTRNWIMKSGGFFVRCVRDY